MIAKRGKLLSVSTWEEPQLLGVGQVLTILLKTYHSGNDIATLSSLNGKTNLTYLWFYVYLTYLFGNITAYV
jgi:hypothetical protein